MSDAALRKAIESAGGTAALGKALGISSAAVSQWDKVPPLRVLEVERLSGVPRHELRPDMYPLPSVSGAPEVAVIEGEAA